MSSRGPGGSSPPTRRDALSLPVRGLLAGALSAHSLGAPSLPEEVIWRIVEFDKVWVGFLRELAGCKEGEDWARGECNVALGRVDYGMWKKSRELAKRLFELEDK